MFALCVESFAPSIRLRDFFFKRGSLLHSGGIKGLKQNPMGILKKSEKEHTIVSTIDNF